MVMYPGEAEAVSGEYSPVGFDAVVHELEIVEPFGGDEREN